MSRYLNMAQYLLGLIFPSTLNIRNNGYSRISLWIRASQTIRNPEKDQNFLTHTVWSSTRIDENWLLISTSAGEEW